MTELLAPGRSRRGSRRTGEPAASPYPFAAAGIGAALWAAVIGLTAAVVVVLLAWAADSRSGAGFGEALRTAAALWLYAGHTGMAVHGGNLGLVPLGLLAVPAFLLTRAGRGLARARPREVGGSVRSAGRAVAVVAVPYALLSGLASLLAGTNRVTPSTSQAMVGAGLLAAVFAGYGVLAGAGTLASVADRLPAACRPVGRGAAASVAALLVAGALITVVSVGLHAGRYAELAASPHAGAVGQVVLVLLGLALLPNAAIFGAAFLAGPGFAVGAGTIVTPYGAHLGSVPALPLLAALPTGATLPWPVALAVLVPVACGVLAGVLVARGLPSAGIRAAAGWSAAAGAVAGIAVGMLAVAAGGSLGPGAMAVVGPEPWLTGVAVAVEVGAAAAAAAAAWRWWADRAG